MVDKAAMEEAHFDSLVDFVLTQARQMTRYLASRFCPPQFWCPCFATASCHKTRSVTTIEFS